MIYTKEWLRRSIGNYLLLFLYIVLSAQQEAKADQQIHDSSRTSSEGIRAESQLRSGYNGSDSGRTRQQQETDRQFESIYKTLYERGLFKMCSIMRSADQQELNQLLGPNYTLVAPSDEAFGLIPGSQFEELMNDKRKQKEFIAQHIIPSRLALSGFRAFDERELKNANGLTHHITAYPNGFVINGANVVDGDIPVPRSNNLIQVVDKVLYPQKPYNLLQVLEDNPHLTQISSFIALSGLQNQLTTNDSFTFFAPNDEAFRAVPWPVTQQMLSNNTFLKLLIANHLIPGKQYATGLAGNKIYSIGGNVLNFTSRTVQSHSLVLVNLVPIIDSDLIATNGVIQVITRIILPKELMDDCKCLPNSTTTKRPDRQSSGNETSTIDPLIEKMLGTDENINNIDRRYGLAPPRNGQQSGDHFTSTPKPVTFRSFWDDLFSATEDPLNANQSVTGNGTQTTGSGDRNTTTLSSTTPNPNVTELPFLWDFLTTETPQPLNQTTDRPVNDSTSRVSATRRLRQYTPGVQYDDESNTTTATTGNGTAADGTASTPQPTSWTRPFYRPGVRRSTTETTAQSATNATETTTPFGIGNSYFRPTVKPVFRPTHRRDTFTAQPNTDNTVPPYDRRYGIQRDRKPINESDDQLTRRSQISSRLQEPIEQRKDDDQYIEQEIENQSHYSPNRTQYPYQRDPKGSQQSYDRRPQSQDIASQPFVRRPYDQRVSPRNESRYLPEEVQQKPYSPTSWTHQQNISHSDSRQQTSSDLSAPTHPSEPPRQQLNWWDSRYEPDVYSVAAFAPPPQDQQRRPQAYDPRTPYQPARPERPRDYRPGVVYIDQSDSHYYRPPTKDRRIFKPRNDTKTSPQSSRAGAARSQKPTSDVYSRPQYMDRSYVPSYDPFARPPMVVGEYPHMYNIDHSYPSMDQFRPPVRQPFQRDQRLDPFDRRRPVSDTKTSSSSSNYDTIRRRGDTRDRKPEETKADPNLKTISEIIESPDLMVGGKFRQFNTLKDMITDSGLWDALNRPTTYITIFMPTDDAFAAITDGSVEQMKRNPKLVRDFLTQHILGYSLPPQNLKNNMKVKSLNGEMHLINVIDGGKIMVDGNEVIAATAAKNGNVYVMDKVLERSGRRSRSIPDELRRRSDLSTFSSLLQRSDLMSQLSRESGPFTVMAPTNTALNNANIRQLIKSQKDLNDFVRKHVMDGAVYSQQLSDPSDGSDNKDIRRVGLSSDAPITINNSTQVISPDITTENGVIHIIDSVLPEKLNITDRSQKLSNEEPDRNGRLSSVQRSAQSLGIRRFTNWLNKSGLLDELIKDGREYTVIVPTDRAVGKLPLKIQSILNSEPSRLTSLLEYHIIPGFVDTKDLKDNEMLTTINSKQIRFNRLEAGKVQTLSGAPINRQQTDKNLLIIAVDSVLYPPQGTVGDLITKSPFLKLVNEIIKTAQMEDELKNSSDITFFAPKDEALKQLAPEILERLKTDQNYSREFLRKHIIPKVLFTSALQVNNETNITHKEQALSGDTLKVYRKPNCVSVNGITLSFADITATNGVLHIIDHTI